MRASTATPAAARRRYLLQCVTVVRQVGAHPHGGRGLRRCRPAPVRCRPRTHVEAAQPDFERAARALATVNGGPQPLAQPVLLFIGALQGPANAPVQEALRAVDALLP